MPGLVPGIHVFTRHSLDEREDVDGRDKPGHDEFDVPNTSTPDELSKVASL
jgi:hypothetical protein